MTESLQLHIEALSEAMRKDPDYAWGWHCNIAVCSMDEGLSNEASNRAAARCMRALFGVDVTEFDEFKRTQRDY